MKEEVACFTLHLVPFGKRTKTLPTVLSHHEVDKLIQCTANLKHRTFLMTLYSGGLRFSEGANLRIADIDSDRMIANWYFPDFCRLRPSISSI